MTRTSSILVTLRLSQPELAQWLRVTQPTVYRLAAGQDEPGPVSRLFDQLEQVIASRGADEARAWLLSGALWPPAPAERPSHIMQAGFGSFG